MNNLGFTVKCNAPFYTALIHQWGRARNQNQQQQQKGYIDLHIYMESVFLSISLKKSKIKVAFIS